MKYSDVLEKIMGIKLFQYQKKIIDMIHKMCGDCKTGYICRVYHGTCWKCELLKRIGG